MRFIKETKFEGVFKDSTRTYRGVYYVEEYASMYRISFRPFGYAFPLILDSVVKKSLLAKSGISIYDYIDRDFNY